MPSKHLRHFWLAAGLYCLVNVVLAWFSYSLTDPNLVLSSNANYWQWQQWMWRTFFDQRQQQASWYAVIVTLQWLAYGWFAWQLWRSREVLSGKLAITVGLLVSWPLFFSYNALSHDVFNYLFNAKMVVQYHANPHQVVALQFGEDQWLRFMHNVHTPAPYGYGWTAISLIPYLLGGGKFVLSWLLMRVWSLSALVFTGWLLWRWLAERGETSRRWLVLVVFTLPHILNEIIMTMHNDFWMLWPAIAAFYVVETRVRSIRRVWWMLLSAILLVFSISIKWATAVLAPLWIANIVWTRVSYRPPIKASIRKLQLFQDGEVIYWLASVGLFLPLLTDRSQFFHPWYLVWSLVWLPLIKIRWWWCWLIGFAIASCYRYLPWLVAGSFESPVLQQQQFITWLGGILFFLFLLSAVPRCRKSL